MRVLMATMQLDIGGAETHIVELSKALARRGVEVFVASNGGAYEKELAESGIKHFSVPLNTKNPAGVVRSYRMLEKIISEYKFDVVHGHARIPSFICGKLHKKLGFPFVTTAHWVFNTKFPFNLLSDWGQRSLAVSEDIKQYLVDNYGIDGDNIRVTINGIDTEKFSADTDFSDIKKEFSLGDDKRRIVYVSRMDTDRSLVAHQLISVAEELYREIPNIEIVIVGGGNDYEAVKAEADRVNSAAGTRLIITTGARTDINKFVASGDIFVGVSRAALEAMSCEKPAIIAGNEGYIGIFDEDKLDISVDTNFCCRGCKASKPEYLAQDIRDLFTKRNREALGKYSRETIKSHYSVETMADDAMKLYSSVLTGSKINGADIPSPEILEKYSLPYGKGIKNDVIISGYYGFRNSGDDTSLKAIIEGLRKLLPKIRITVLSKKPDETKRIYKVDAINRMNLPKIKRRMRHSSLLISGGGSLIQDATSGKSLMYYLAIIRMAQRTGIKTMLYGNGIGPVLNRRYYPQIEKILSRVDAITLREPDSLAAMEEMGISTSKTSITADAAFSLVGADLEDPSSILKNIGINEGEEFFCVSVRKWKNLAQDFENELAKTCRYVSEKYGLTPLFIPMQYNQDGSICRRIMDKSGVRAVMVKEDLNIYDMLRILSRSRLVVGMRLHILIYSACAGIPVVGLSYDPKVDNMMKYMGQNYSLPVSSLTYNKLKELCDEIIENREDIVKSLEEVRQRAKVSADKNSAIAVDLLKL